MKDYFRGLLTNSLKDAKVVLLGIPYDLGCSCGSGASLAPSKMRELSAFLPPFTMDGKSCQNTLIYDLGDFHDTLDFYHALELKAKDVFNLNKFPLFLGGDHSISIALEKSFKEYATKLGKTPVIIHIDAHPDICDIYHDSKYSHACPNMRAIENGYETKNITFIGIRGYEDQEVEYLQNHPELKVYNASYINEFGYDDILNDLITRFSSNKYAIYLSYDIDANDPSFAPGTGTPEAFGLNSYELMKFIRKLFINLPIFAMDLVEVSPRLDNNDITSWLALKTLLEIFEILQNKEVIR